MRYYWHTGLTENPRSSECFAPLPFCGLTKSSVVTTPSAEAANVLWSGIRAGGHVGETLEQRGVPHGSACERQRKFDGLYRWSLPHIMVLLPAQFFKTYFSCSSSPAVPSRYLVPAVHISRFLRSSLGITHFSYPVALFRKGYRDCQYPVADLDGSELQHGTVRRPEIAPSERWIS